MFNSNSREFRTRRLHLASFLHAGAVLNLLRVERVNGRAEFIFDDPSRLGPESEVAFDRGAVVPATALFTSLTFCRRAIDAAIESGAENDYQPHRR
jgi:hypothetical protein